MPCITITTVIISLYINPYILAELEYIFCLTGKHSLIVIPPGTPHAPMHEMGRSNFRHASAAKRLEALESVCARSAGRAGCSASPRRHVEATASSCWPDSEAKLEVLGIELRVAAATTVVVQGLLLDSSFYLCVS